MITGLECAGRHGVYPAERELGQRFVVDVAAELRACPATRSDDLAETLDYATLADAIVEIVSGPPVNLLEHLAQRIADRVLQEPIAYAVTVTVHKPHVAIPHVVAETAVSLRRARTAARDPTAPGSRLR
ncbi:MAG: dihydroneopterin aldolase [Actinobacteria bacterium]|nr:dihydroneopterin aldolase [Actinomycetota bacterium]